MKCIQWSKTENHKLDKKAEAQGDVLNLDNEATTWRYIFVKLDGDKHTITTNHPLDVVIGDVVTLEELARRHQRAIMT